VYQVVADDLGGGGVVDGDHDADAVRLADAAASQGRPEDEAIF
jgi:hypothetical protein